MSRGTLFSLQETCFDGLMTYEFHISQYGNVGLLHAYHRLIEHELEALHDRHGNAGLSKGQESFDIVVLGDHWPHHVLEHGVVKTCDRAADVFDSVGSVGKAVLQRLSVVA